MLAMAYILFHAKMHTISIFVCNRCIITAPRWFLPQMLPSHLFGKHILNSHLFKQAKCCGYNRSIIIAEVHFAPATDNYRTHTGAQELLFFPPYFFCW